MKNILITGGLGFIGFNAIQLWKREKPEYNYFILDKETYAAQFMFEEKREWLMKNNIPLFKCNICDSFSVESLINQYNIDTIVNFAAESHVDNSINNPVVFFESNIIGVTTLLDIVKKYNLRFHQIGTDEVYGETTPDSWDDIDKSYNFIDIIKHPEFQLLLPSSPYSSSKASADLIVLSYYKTFGTNVTVSRCSNNFGKYQHCEKLIGTVISKALKNEKIPVYGKGNQKRHWIHVDEHNISIMDILEKGECGRVYNIAPPKENYITNMTLIKFILKMMKKPYELIDHVTDRLGHDTSYFLYGTEFCQREKKWKSDMKETIDWYMEKLS